MAAKTNRQIEADKRRQLILETAVRAFLELGYQRTGIREIARRAGVSLGNLYNHFPGKEAVLIEIARIEAQEVTVFIALLREDGPARERMLRFLEAYLRYAAEPDNVLLSVEILAEAVRTPAVAEVFDATQSRLIAALTDCVAAMSPADATDQTDRARLILELVEAHARHIVFSGRTCGKNDLATVLGMVGSGIGVALAP